MPFGSDGQSKLTPKTTHKKAVRSLQDRLGIFGKSKSTTKIPAIINRSYSFAEYVNLDSTLRRGKQTADTLDTLTSLGSGITDVTAKSFVVAGDPRASSFTNDAVSSAWLIPNALPGVIAQLLYLLRIRRSAAAGKQNRELKTAYAIIYGTLLPIGITAAVIVGMLGFPVALVVAPILSIVATSIALGRIIQKWKRAFDGSNPETLLKQKIQKVKLAKSAGNTAREIQFTKQSMVLDYFLREFRVNDLPVDKNNLNFERALQDYKMDKKAEKTFNDKLLDKLINRYFQNDYTIFMDWLNQQRKLPAPNRDKSYELYHRLAREKAMDQIISQEDKLRWRTRFLIALGIMFLAAIVLAVGAIVPFALPALALTFKLVGAIGGSVVFAGAASAGVMAGILNYRQYKSWVEENKKNPALISQMRTAMGLQVSGMALFIASAALVGLSFIPFINLIVIAAVGAAIIAAGLTLLSVGIYKAYQARKAAAELSAVQEKENETNPDQEIIHIHTKGFKPIPSHLPAHTAKKEQEAAPFADEEAIATNEAISKLDPLNQSIPTPRELPRMGQVLFREIKIEKSTEVTQESREETHETITPTKKK